MRKHIKKLLRLGKYVEVLERINFNMFRSQCSSASLYLLASKSFCLFKLNNFRLSHDILEKDILTRDLENIELDTFNIINDTLINLGCFNESYFIMTKYKLKDRTFLHKLKSIELMNDSASNNIERPTHVLKMAKNDEKYIENEFFYEDRFNNFQFLCRNIYLLSYEDLFKFICKFLIKKNSRIREGQFILEDVHLIIKDLSKNERPEVLLLLVKRLYKDKFCYLSFYVIGIVLDIYISLLRSKYEILSLSLQHAKNYKITEYNPLDCKYYEVLYILRRILGDHKDIFDDILVTDKCKCNDNIPFNSKDIENTVIKIKIITKNGIYGYNTLER